MKKIQTKDMSQNTDSTYTTLRTENDILGAGVIKNHRTLPKTLNYSTSLKGTSDKLFPP